MGLFFDGKESVKKARLILLAVPIVLALFFWLEKSSVRGISSTGTPPKNLYLLESVIRLIRNDYLEEKDPAQIVDGSFKGLVNSLDSNSSYLSASSTARYFEQKGSLPKEPGIIVFKRYGAFPQVIGLIDNSPAQQAGLQIGDLITEINGLSTPAMSLAEVNLYLRDKEEVPVDLKVLREEKTLAINVGRAFLSADPVVYSVQEGTSGILRIARMNASALNEIKTRWLPNLRKSKKALIIDLRNCQEGTFGEARQFINLFLKADRIGYFQKRGDTKEALAAPDEPLLASLPVVIWVNQATFGPAETVAAVLKEFKRAKIVGLATLGLAGESEFIQLKDGSSVLLTSGIFCLNSGVRLWGQGAEPDLKVDVDNQSFDLFLKQTQSLLATS
jgi:C-terminal peptidase prc